VVAHGAPWCTTSQVQQVRSIISALADHLKRRRDRAGPENLHMTISGVSDKGDAVPRIRRDHEQKTRRNHTPAFKAKVAACRRQGRSNTGSAAGAIRSLLNQLTSWKAQLGFASSGIIYTYWKAPPFHCPHPDGTSRGNDPGVFVGSEMSATDKPRAVNCGDRARSRVLKTDNLPLFSPAPERRAAARAWRLTSEKLPRGDTTFIALFKKTLSNPFERRNLVCAVKNRLSRLVDPDGHVEW